VTYAEKRVRLADYRSLPRDSPLLVEVPGTLNKPRKLHHLAAASLERMAAAVKRELDIELLVASGWRSRRWATRAAYEASMIERYGSVREGRKWKAYESPHETGLAVDFGTGGLAPVSKTADKQRDTPLHRWLVEHAHEYGFTPYKREPWHWEFWIEREAFERLPRQ